MTQLKPSAQRVQEALFVMGYTSTVVELPDSTRTAAEAAQAIGCNVAQIAKSCRRSRYLSVKESPSMAVLLERHSAM